MAWPLQLPAAWERDGLILGAMHLLLIEDDAVIARELLLRWRGRGWQVRACASLAEAGSALAGDLSGQAVELVVLDLGLPDGDGVQWLARFRQQDRRTPVIVLTARDRVADRVLGLKIGADDYLVKPFDPEELDARIEALQRRGQVGRGEWLQFGRLRWLGGEGRAYVDLQVLELMPREFEVLGLLISRAPRLLPRRVLIDALAERNLEVGDSAAEVYVSRLRRKLAGSGTTIRTLRGFGYVLALADSGDPG
ncbi:MAG: response regulator transcription factor [Rubrivivax sp.]|nr:response regulator transcription factor [Rubrivivax sp.]